MNCPQIKISCSYLFKLNQRIEWEILSTDKIHYIEEKFERTFNPEEIQEFIFEVQTDAKKAHNLTQVAVAYVVEKNQSNPIEFFRLCVREKTTLTSNTKSYQFAETILKTISENYAIPYRFKRNVNTQQKNKNFWMSVIIGLAALVGGLFWGLLLFLR